MSEVPSIQCRACLTKLCYGSHFIDIFRPWNPVFFGMGLSIAEDLAKLTNIEINVSDSLPKSICKRCCNKLQDAIKFSTLVQSNDTVLKEKYKVSMVEKPVWPKPIQVDKNITCNELNEMTVEVKQEVLTEDECELNEQTNEYQMLDEQNLDIKVEPEEITPSISIKVNGPYSLLPEQFEDKENGIIEALEESLHDAIKEEPMSEDEIEPSSDMPKDCMLCFKTFQSVKGLKAHVISVHSYESVTSARTDRSNVCTTCNISFATPTDLFVHQTCHSQYTCYVCDKKFESFQKLSQHRGKKCTKTNVLPRLKTLEDVRRIAHNRGTETLQLFDLHVPIDRIKDLKIDGDEFRKIMDKKELKDKHSTKKRKVKVERDGDTNESDLYNLLNGNVMSVIVNLRIPEDVKEEARPDVLTKTIKTEQTDDLKIPETEHEYHSNPKLIVKPRNRRKINASKTNVYAKQYKSHNRTRNLYNPLSENFQSIEKDDANDIIPLEHVKIEIKQEIEDNIELDIIPVEVINDKLKKSKDNDKLYKKETNPIQEVLKCKRQCKEKIPEHFRLKVYEHYWSLASLLERRNFLLTMLDRRINSNNKFKNIWHLKYESHCYKICRVCLSDTLGLRYNYFQHPKRLSRAKAQRRPTIKRLFKPVSYINHKNTKNEPITEKKHEQSSHTTDITEINQGSFANQSSEKLGPDIPKEEDEIKSNKQNAMMNSVEQLLEAIHRETVKVPEKCNIDENKADSNKEVHSKTPKVSSQSNDIAIKNYVKEDKLNSNTNGPEQVNTKIKQERGFIEINIPKSNSHDDVKEKQILNASKLKTENEETESYKENKQEIVDTTQGVKSGDVNKIKVETVVKEQESSPRTKDEINTISMVYAVSSISNENVLEATAENMREENILECILSTVKYSNNDDAEIINTNNSVKNDDNDKNLENSKPLEDSEENLDEETKLAHTVDESMDIDLK